MSLKLFSLAALCILFAGTTSAQKYNLTRAIQSDLVAGHETPDTVCNLAGICYPVNRTIPARSLWYWCGFLSTHRTVYSVKSLSSANLTTMYLMRQSMLEDCALPNVTWVGDRCKSIPESSCSNKKTCNVRVFGLVFPDPVCFVIINNDKKGNNITATIRINNFHDSPRYYGTVFVLLFTIVGGLAIIANVGWQFYTIIIAPVGKHAEPIKVKRDDDNGDAERGNGTAAAGGPVSGAPSKSSWYHRLMGKLRAHVSSDHQL